MSEIENEKLVDIVNLVPSYFNEQDIEFILKNIELGENMRLGPDWLMTSSGLSSTLDLFDSLISTRLTDSYLTIRLL